MQDQATAAITITAACELGRHGACRGVVLSLTNPVGETVTCQCPICQHDGAGR